MPTYPIAIEHLTKRFGSVRALEDVSFTVTPGRVTGFLGPNGAGKTTTLRILLGLDQADSGQALVGERPYRDYPSSALVVGASLEADSFHPGRSGRNHLRVYGAAMGADPERIDEVLSMVGLTGAAGRKVGGYSLGMRQRLGLATALLADPPVLVLDEPANGLDPEGIRWMRELLQYLAGQGRTVLISSHLLGEVQQIAQDIVIINRGQVVAAGDLREIEAGRSTSVLVNSVDNAALARALHAAQLSASRAGNQLAVTGATPEAVGAIALQAGVALTHLSQSQDDLEAMFLELTGGAR